MVNVLLKRSDCFLDLYSKLFLRINLLQICLWILLSMVILVPTSLLYAQDPGDEEGEVFWGGDEEEDEEYE